MKFSANPSFSFFTMFVSFTECLDLFWEGQWRSPQTQFLTVFCFTNSDSCCRLQQRCLPHNDTCCLSPSPASASYGIAVRHLLVLLVTRCSSPPCPASSLLFFWLISSGWQRRSGGQPINSDGSGGGDVVVAAGPAAAMTSANRNSDYSISTLRKLPPGFPQ